MKKSLIALAVAGAMTAPIIAQADATLYGRIEQRLKFVDVKDNGVSADEDAKLEADDIRIGVRGDTAFDGTNTVGIYQFEYEVNPDANTYADATSDEATTIAVRTGFIGAKGDFGTVVVGRINNPVERIIGYTGNLSEDTGVQDGLNPDRLGSAIAYVSPAMSGVNVYGAVVVAGQGDSANESDVDGYVLGADYSMGDLNASIGYWEFDKKFTGGTGVGTTAASDDEFLAIGGEYTMGATKFGAIYENFESVDGADKEEIDVISFRVQHAIDNITLAARYHESEESLQGEALDIEADQIALSAVYRLGKNATLDIEYVTTDYDNVDHNAGEKDSRDTLSFGYALTF